MMLRSLRPGTVSTSWRGDIASVELTDMEWDEEKMH